MESTPAVRARGIRKGFGDVVALDGVDLDIAPAAVHGLIGPNGAGKSTLLGMLLGLTAPDAGALEVLGSPVSRPPVVPDGVAGFVEAPGAYPALTARQNLRAVGDLRGLGYADRRASEALDRVGLAEVADDRVHGFSLGMRQRLGLAASLLLEPRLLVLDEPANGLDPAGRRQVHEVLTDLTTAGTAIVLSSHRMDDLAALCAEVTLLAAGRVVFSGPVAKLTTESGVVQHRLVTTDPGTARRLAAGVAGLRARADQDAAGALVLDGPVPAIDALVAALVTAGVAVRELAPVLSPLEAAFLSLTGADR